MSGEIPENTNEGEGGEEYTKAELEGATRSIRERIALEQLRIQSLEANLQNVEDHQRELQELLDMEEGIIPGADDMRQFIEEQRRVSHLKLQGFQEELRVFEELLEKARS